MATETPHVRGSSLLKILKLNSSNKADIAKVRNQKAEVKTLLHKDFRRFDCPNQNFRCNKAAIEARALKDGKAELYGIGGEVQQAARRV
ncbi:MAG: hypothetical protein F6J95_020340 [Leptolyngbya sp. SIO1E4]|nr:hypothetical protein [Leptolyngbya sp. SIO1E4]